MLRLLLRSPDDDVVANQRADHQRRADELDRLETMSLRDPDCEHRHRNEVDEQHPVCHAHELVAWLGARHHLRDVTFQEPEIEDVIRRIYEEGLLLQEDEAPMLA